MERDWGAAKGMEATYDAAISWAIQTAVMQKSSLNAHDTQENITTYIYTYMYVK